MKNRRKLSNFIVDSGAILRLSIPFFALVIANVVVALIATWRVSQYLGATDDSSPALAAALLEISTRVTNPLLWGMLVSALLSVMLFLIFSHRIFGPIVPIRRQIGNLAKGDYDSRVSLRRGDEFKEVAEDLNKLAEILKASRK